MEMRNITDTITITRPDDWHLHVRDGDMTALSLPHTASVFGRALIMPNLNPPITNLQMACAYRKRIISQLAKNAINAVSNNFKPKMALYLTPNTTVEEINTAAKNQDLIAIKWYPAGATTNSSYGVSLETFASPAIQKVIDAIEDNNMVLCIHGEVVDPHTDIFDRERVFIEQVLAPLLALRTSLRVVLEHISSRQAVDFIMDESAKRQGANFKGRIAATITAHHLAFDRNTMLVGGIRPHYYCLPILKRSIDRKALIRAATSGNAAFFLGTDSAPHVQSTKESACGCAGVYSAPVAMPLYAQVFEAENALDKLNDFAGKFGANFYQQPINTEQLTLKRKAWQVPKTYTLGNKTVVPLLAGETLMWQVEK